MVLEACICWGGESPCDRKGTGEALEQLIKTQAQACWIFMHREGEGTGCPGENTQHSDQVRKGTWRKHCPGNRSRRDWSGPTHPSPHPYTEETEVQRGTVTQLRSSRGTPAVLAEGFYELNYAEAPTG